MVATGAYRSNTHEVTHEQQLLGLMCSLPIAIFSIKIIRLTTADQKLSLLSRMFPNLQHPSRPAWASLLTVAWPLAHDVMHELLNPSLMPVFMFNVSCVCCSRQQQEWRQLGLANHGLAE